MNKAEELLPVADLQAAGFAVSEVETEDNTVSCQATRNSVGWTVWLEVAEPGPQLDQVWAETLEYIRVVAEADEPVEQVPGIGDAAVHWDDELRMRAGPAVINIRADGPAPDPATSRMMCEWVAHRVLARLAPATYQPPRLAPPPDAPPAALPNDEVHWDQVTAQVDNTLERERKWLQYKLSQSGAVPDPELSNALAEVESALADLREPDLAPAAPDHPLTSTRSLGSSWWQHKLLRRRWDELVPGQAKAGKELIKRYDAPRAHSLVEFLMALPQLDANAARATDPAAVELAVWFHAAGGEAPSGETDVEAAVQQAWQVLRAAGIPDTRVTEVIRLLRLQNTRTIPNARSDPNGRLLTSILHCFLGRMDLDDELDS